MASSHLEIELKLEVADVDAVETRLRELGAETVAPRAFEDNRLFDSSDRSLTGAGRLLRLRESGGKVILTAKGPSPGSDPRYKIRREEEVTVLDDGSVPGAGSSPGAGSMSGSVSASAAGRLTELLHLAGFETLWRYQKYRHTFRWKDAEVVIDETPAGAFVEIEGPPAAIEDLVAELGPLAGRRIPGTYRDVWEEHQRSDTPGDMLFANDGETP